MKKSGKWLIAAAVLIIVGGAIFVFAMGMSRWNFSSIGSEDLVTDTAEPAGSFGSVLIESHTENIVFKRSDNGKCRVVFRVPEGHEHEAFVQNGVLTVTAKEFRARNGSLLSFSSGSPSITVYLPGTEYEKLSVSESTGDVSIPVGFSFDSMEIALSTGDVDCAASCTGKAGVKTSTGDIRLSQMSAGQLDLSVSTGAVTLDSVSCTGSLGIGVGTGKITLTNVSCGSFVSEGGTGRVTLTNVLADGLLSVTRTTGDIMLQDCDAGELYLAATTGRIDCLLLSPKTFSAHTSTGRVSIPENFGAEGKCTVTTTTGNIKIEVSK